MDFPTLGFLGYQFWSHVIYKYFNVFSKKRVQGQPSSSLGLTCQVHVGENINIMTSLFNAFFLPSQWMDLPGHHEAKWFGSTFQLNMNHCLIVMTI